MIRKSKKLDYLDFINFEEPDAIDTDDSVTNDDVTTNSELFHYVDAGIVINSGETESNDSIDYWILNETNNFELTTDSNSNIDDYVLATNSTVKVNVLKNVITAVNLNSTIEFVLNKESNIITIENENSTGNMYIINNFENNDKVKFIEFGVNKDIEIVYNGKDTEIVDSGGNVFVVINNFHLTYDNIIV